LHRPRAGSRFAAAREAASALEVRVAGHQRVGLRLGERERDERKRVDRLTRALARVDDVETQRRGGLVVPRTTRVDLLADGAEEALDRRVDVLVRAEHRLGLVRDRREPLLDLAQLVRRQEAGPVQPRRVLGRGRAVVGKELEIVGAQELPHGGIELALGAA